MRSAIAVSWLLVSIFAGSAAAMDLQPKVGGGAPTGAASGDLSGTYPSPVVAKASGASGLAVTYGVSAGSITVPGTVITSTTAIFNGGNVGIGTVAPGAKLDVAGAARVSGSGAGLQICDRTDSSCNSTWYSPSNTDIRLNTASGDVFTIQNGGNVGIGTTSPTHLFQVGGGTLSVTSNGHLSTAGSAPAIGACGTTPSLAANSDDTAGVINTGTGVFTSCAITFSNAYTNAPSCFCIDQTTTLAVRATPTNTGMTCAGTFTASDVLAYICLGRSE